MADELPIDPGHWTAKLWCEQSSVLITRPFISYETIKAELTFAQQIGLLAEQPTAAGLEEGEKRQLVHAVVRADVEGNYGTSNRIDLYHEDQKWKFLAVYLNNDQDIAAFESVSGLKVAGLPNYVGAGHIERGVNKQADALVVKTPKPFAVVFKPNPAHDPNTETGKKKPARLFVRWADQQPPQPVNGAPAAATTDLDWAGRLVKHSEWLAGQPDIDSFNKCRNIYAGAPQAIKLAMAKKGREHALGRGWVVADNGAWVEPVKDTDPIPF